jgi:hypothetical protein
MMVFHQASWVPYTKYHRQIMRCVELKNLSRWNSSIFGVYICLTNFIWCLISTPECHVMFSKTKMNVNWELFFLLKCCLNVTCLVVHVKWHAICFFTSPTTCQNLNCACQLTCAFFGCKFLRVKCQKLAKTLSKLHIGIFLLKIWKPMHFSKTVTNTQRPSIYILI